MHVRERESGVSCDLRQGKGEEIRNKKGDGNTVYGRGGSGVCVCVCVVSGLGVGVCKDGSLL